MSPEWHIGQADELLRDTYRHASSSSFDMARIASEAEHRAQAHALTAIAMLLREHNAIQRELLT